MVKYSFETKNPENYVASEQEAAVRDFIDGRVQKMKEYRKNIPGLNIEDKWKEADSDYSPSSSTLNKNGKRFELSDTKGYRSKLVNIGTDKTSWRNFNSEPTLLTKIQTVLSILIDRDPEAVFQAVIKKYDQTIDIAKAVLNASWSRDSFKQQLKLFVFNLAKYGWSIGKTSPRILKRKKNVLVEYDEKNPENNKYEEREVVDFNGLHREVLDNYRTWIDEMTLPNDPLSTNDWYYEKDYDYKSAEIEFGNHPNWKYVAQDSYMPPDDKIDDKDRRDIVTIGFYENRNRDLLGIYIPKSKILLSYAPLPNDEGKLSLWQTYWVLRDVRIPYGIGIYEIIKQKKALYDKMMNMTMDQLVLSIYKMFFYTGTSLLEGDGEIKIEPGKGHQIIGGDVKWMDVPGPGKESWQGLQYLKAGIDDDSGAPPIIEGELSGKTLGEVLNAKESALKRMNVPLNNIADALAQEAYISISWLGQILSTPEVLKFIDEDDLMNFQEEQQMLAGQAMPDLDEFGNQVGIKALFYPQIPLKLDKVGERLIESREDRFFQIGQDLLPTQVKWEGIIRVVPASILVPSLELEKQRNQEMYNLLVPILQQPPELYAKPAKQLCKVNAQDEKDWLPDAWIAYLQTGSVPQPPQPLFIDTMGQEQQQGGQQGGGGIGQKSNRQDETLKGQAGLTPTPVQTVVPRDEAGMPKESGVLGRLKNIMGSMSQRK